MHPNSIVGTLDASSSAEPGNRDGGRDPLASWDLDSLLALVDQPIIIEGKKSNVKINDVTAIERATRDNLTFCRDSGQKGVATVSGSNAGVILCKSDLRGLVHPKDERQLLIFTENPRLAFIRIFDKMLSSGIREQIQAEHPKVQSRKSTEQAGSTVISPTAVISKNSKLGQNCVVGEYVVIGENCVIGDGTTIYDRVSLARNCIIGKNCVIQSGVSMGSDGFAFERTKEKKLVKFPHKGFVRIGDNVEICVNCSIARGSLSDTIIGDGTKLDALVHVAHNVVIGKNCALTAGTIIGGSASLGDNCWTGLNSTLKHKIKLGNNVIVGSGASVIRDVPDGDIVAGVPARSIKDKIHISAEELYMMAGIEGPPKNKKLL